MTAPIPTAATKMSSKEVDAMGTRALLDGATLGSVLEWARAAKSCVSAPDQALAFSRLIAPRKRPEQHRPKRKPIKTKRRRRVPQNIAARQADRRQHIEDVRAFSASLDNPRQRKRFDWRSLAASPAALAKAKAEIEKERARGFFDV